MLIDRITEWHPGSRAVAVKCVALSEDFFEDHFPGKPVFPGALILEGMAQLSGLLLEEAAKAELGMRSKALLSIVEKMKFRAPVYPGERIEYRAEITSINQTGGRATVRAACNGDRRAEGALVFTFHEFNDDLLERRQQEIVALWKQDLA
jgi:3-hydroxyacyl-[acyl-carrier-protein] dehydratase